MSDDKPRFQWSATEIVGIGIDNPERVRKTEDGKTVLMPSDYPIGVISEWTPPEREVVRVTPLKFPIDHGGVRGLVSDDGESAFLGTSGVVVSGVVSGEE
jgi:hypothetical protein